MSGLKVEYDVLGMVSTNCYYLINEKTKEALIVDPADCAERIKSHCMEKGLCVKGILLTHGHFDHIMAADDIRKIFGVSIYASAPEKEVLTDAGKNLSAGWASPYMLEADEYLYDGQVIELAGFSIQVILTPGHTIGGVCYYFADENVLISGDTLFEGSYGRTDFPTSSMAQLSRSINDKLMALPEEVKVYPGHGGSTTIGAEKRYNPIRGFR